MSLTNPSRRDVIRAGAAAAALAATGSLARAAEEAPATATAPASQPAAPLPTRPLGKTGVKVTVLNLGCGGEPPQRLLDHAYAQGIRYFDTAAGYARNKSEQAIGAWFERTGKRKEIFVITKDPVSDPEALLTKIDERCRALRTDYVDAYFMHGLGGKNGVEWPKSDQVKEVAAKLKKSGKIKFFGFSCHASNAPDCLLAAAEGGFIDAIVMSYNPVTGSGRDEKLDRAFDACHKAGIGLVAMKTIRGMSKSLSESDLGDLTIHQAVIQAVLSDQRIASVCSEMENLTQIDQNTQAVRLMRKPMEQAQVDRLRAILLAGGYTFCPGCPACRAGVLSRNGHVQDILRYLSYYEQDGKRSLARELYRALPPEARELSGADLAAARDACALHVDYPTLIARAQAKLA